MDREQLAGSLVEIVDRLQDVDHREVLRLLPAGDPGAILAILDRFRAYVETLEGSARLLRGMRICRIQADLYRRLAACTTRAALPACGLDDEEIIRRKQEGDLAGLPAAYEARINQLQRLDLRQSLAALGAPAPALPMRPADYDKKFQVEAPLRLGISSANASDNHLRTKEQGGKTLNAGIDLQVEGEDHPAPPLRVTVRRLSQKGLVLHSRSTGFEADFALLPGEDSPSQRAQFFAYRRGGDEALRLVKQALVHTGILRDDTEDLLAEIAAFTGGGGLEVETRSKVLQGSGLGTSSILAASILKALYRLAGNPIAAPENEYPGLYDQSLLLEQSVGLNSGWQDARGALGGPGAVKDFCAPPTLGLPDPRVRFIEIDEELFAQRVVLFNTGIARLATRGLNVVLDAYLSRDGGRYPAIQESLRLHDQMVAALSAGDYPALGRLASRYWQMRCTLDPGATNSAIQRLFEEPELRALCEGGTLTGAGGGGFGLLVCRQGKGQALRERLRELRADPAYARSGVVEYRLNRIGIRLMET